MNDSIKTAHAVHVKLIHTLARLHTLERCFDGKISVKIYNNGNDIVSRVSHKKRAPQNTDKYMVLYKKLF